MATKIIMRDTGTALDVNPEMNIEMKVTSPVFSEVGSQTVSDVLPVTPKNNRELLFPDRPDAADKVKELYPVIMESGSFHRAGELYVTGSGEDGISFNIGTNESIMYAKMKQKNLSDLENLPVYEDPVPVLIDYLHATRDDLDAPVTVFPVVISDETVNGKRILITANQYKNPDANGFVGLLWEARQTSQVIDGTEMQITVPDGYGVAPFPKVWKILEMIFESFGMIIVENIFKTHFQLKLLTGLHNCMDCICFGKIDYRQILPDCTVNDFLEALHNKFGALVFVDSDNNQVRIKLLKDVLLDASYKDFTKNKTKNLTWTKISPKQIRLKLTTGLAGAKPPMENYSDFLKSRNNIISSVTGYEQLKESSPVSIQANNIYSTATCLYYTHFQLGFSFKRELLGSDFFDWDQRTADMEYEEYTSKDESIPLMYFADIYPYYIPCYIVGLKHINTALKSDNADKEKESGAKPAFLFYFGLPEPDRYSPVINRFYTASPFAGTLGEGNPIQSPSGETYPVSLTARSIFMYFWKGWDAVLRHAGQEYETELKLSEADTFSLEMYRKIRIDHQPYLPKEFNFTVDGRKNSGITLCSLRLRKPCNLEEDHYVPTPEPQNYKWIVNDNFDELAAAKGHELQQQGYGIIRYERIGAPAINDIEWSLPPGREDYDAGKKIFTKNYTGGVYASWGSTPIDHPVQFSYQAWFTPAPMS
jgi:hypothetical protein